MGLRVPEAWLEIEMERSVVDERIRSVIKYTCEEPLESPYFVNEKLAEFVQLLF